MSDNFLVVRTIENQGQTGDQNSHYKIEHCKFYGVNHRNNLSSDDKIHVTFLTTMTNAMNKNFSCDKEYISFN